MPIIPTLLDYLRRPVFTVQRRPLGHETVVELAKLFGLTLCLAVIAVMFTGSLYILIEGRAPEPAESFEELTQSTRFFWAAVIIAPLFEEGLFRSWLGHMRGVLIAMPVLLCSGVIVMITSSGQDIPHIALPASALVLSALVLYLKRYSQTKRIKGHHDAAMRRIFPFAFWGSAVVFALIHVGNYASDEFQLHMALLVAPQFIIGVILGFVRMRYGLLAAIGFHGLYNSIFVGLTFFA